MGRFSHRHLAYILKNAYKTIKLGQYTHIKTGMNYNVTGIALEEKTVTPVVVYRDANNIIWTRDLQDFSEKFSLKKN